MREKPDSEGNKVFADGKTLSGAVSQNSEGNNSPNISHVSGSVNISYVTEAVSDPSLELFLFPVSPSTRMHFRAQRVPFTGRVGELVRLQEFLLSSPPFQWWLVVGEAGVGKSRLALELCLRHQETWLVGFLSENSEYAAWPRWLPKQNTLVVVDYAATRSKELQTAIATLAARAAALKERVRILLLERSAESNWRKELLGTGSMRLLTESVCYDEPLKIGHMSDDELWKTITFISDESVLNNTPNREETLNALLRLDPLRRPLFAALAADAISAGRDIRSWDQTALIRDVLEREEDRFWKPAGVTERDKSLLGFVTMVGGMRVDQLSYLSGLSGMPTTAADDPMRYNASRYERMTGLPATKELAPLEPDVVGEFFALERLKPKDDADVEHILETLVMAWITRPSGVLDFANRIFQDFPRHAGTLYVEHTLRKTVIEIMLSLIKGLGNDADAGISFLFTVGVAKTSLIFACLNQERTEDAQSHFDELLQMVAESSVAESSQNSFLNQFIMVAAPALYRDLRRKGDTEGGARIFQRVGASWFDRGSDPNHLDILVTASLGIARLWLSEGLDLAVALCEEIVRIGQNFTCPSSSYGVMAREARALLEACLGLREYAPASKIFLLFAGLRNHASENLKFVANIGLAGVELVMEFPRLGSHDPTASIEFAEILELTRVTVRSPQFKKGALLEESDAKIAQGIMSVFARLDEQFGTTPL